MYLLLQAMENNARNFETVPKSGLVVAGIFEIIDSAREIDFDWSQIVTVG